MSRLDETEQRQEIAESIAVVSEITGVDVQSFCYPYGGELSFNDLTEQILYENGVTFSVSVADCEARLVDFEERPHAIPRLDCNKFPFGACA